VGEAARKIEKHRLGGATKKKIMYYIRNTCIAYAVYVDSP